MSLGATNDGVRGKALGQCSISKATTPHKVYHVCGRRRSPVHHTCLRMFLPQSQSASYVLQYIQLEKKRKLDRENTSIEGNHNLFGNGHDYTQNVQFLTLRSSEAKALFVFILSNVDFNFGFLLFSSTTVSFESQWKNHCALGM